MIDIPDTLLAALDAGTNTTRQAAHIIRQQAAEVANLRSELAEAKAGQAALIEAAAATILSDDIALSRMAQGMHDGPLGANDHWFSAARPQGAWCLDMARAGLRALIAKHRSGE